LSLKRFVLAAALFGFSFAAAAQTAARPPAPKAAPAAPASAVPKVEFEKFTLSNGLQVILHVDRKLPIVHVNLWFHVGSKNERPGRTGFAHLFEHMMFQGSKNAPKDYFTYVEKAGANLQEGGVNGTTNQDRTNYFATVPSGNLENLLWLESDRLATLTEAITKENLDNQRDVVKNERRQGLENTPYGRWFKLMFEGLFPAGHGYSWTTIGSQEDLTAASLDDVNDFFKTFYSPSNLSLVVAGDFDPAEAKKLVEKYFAGIPPGPPLDRPTRWIPALNGEKIIDAIDRVPQERVYMIWPTPEYFAPGDAELDLTGLILTDGLSSRLNKALVYDRQLCTAVNSFNNAQEIAGMFVVIATARPGVGLPQIESIVTDEIAKLAKTGPTPEELARAKTKQEYNFVSGLERIGGFGGKADLLNQYNTFLGDPGKFDEDVARYGKVTAADLRATVAKYLDTRNRLLVQFLPEKAGRPAEVALDRSKQPALGTDRPFHAPEVKTATLENGLQVFVVERTELPKVAVTFATRAGSTTEPAARAGLAQMTATNVRLGTATRKALEIEDALGNLGTAVAGTASRESSQLDLEVLKRNLDPALAIVGDVVRNPSFPDSELDREKKRQLDVLSQQAKNANAISGRLRPMLAFGPDHPYGHPTQGLPGTIESLSRADLVDFHRSRWKPGSSALVLVGDVTLAEATELARRHFGAWTGGAAPAVTIPPPSPAPSDKVYLVDRQDAAQTVISQVLPAPERGTPDYYALQLADSVWGGGGFGTRLNLNLRENKGYSYGVFSTLAQYRNGGYWFAAGGVQTAKTKESIVEFDSELDGFAGAKPITEEEFEEAKVKRVRGYSQQFEGLSRVGGEIVNLWALGLPMDELQRETDETMKVTLQATRDAAKKYVRPDAATLLLVGDAAKIEPGVKELKLGDVVRLDAEGKPAGK
jgi:zinc protease